MSRIVLLVCSCAALLLSGCASETASRSNNLTDTGHVNTIPWNRPERWEGTGTLGGMLNTQ